MVADDSFAFFSQTVQDPWKAAKEWKEKTGGAVIGWLPADVPEELIMAAGALPVAIVGSGGTINLADAHLQVWACSFARSGLELALRGDLSFLDGVVIPQTCDTTRTLYGIWRHCFPGRWVEVYLLPRQVERPSAAAYLREELLRLKAALEKLTGREITPTGLAQAWELNASCRRLLGRLYDWHAAHPEAFSSEELYTIIRAATLLPKEDLLPRLQGLVAALGVTEVSRAELAAAGMGRGKQRVFLSGSLAAPADIFSLFEEAGLTVVGDDLHLGYRYLFPAEPAGEDPLGWIIARQLHLPPTGYLNPVGVDRRHYLLEALKRRGAKGLVFLHLRFCEPENYDYYDLNQALAQAGVPALRLETDFQGTSLGQIATRLEAFAEMLGGGIDA